MQVVMGAYRRRVEKRRVSETTGDHAALRVRETTPRAAFDGVWVRREGVRQQCILSLYVEALRDRREAFALALADVSVLLDVADGPAEDHEEDDHILGQPGDRVEHCAINSLHAAV